MTPGSNTSDAAERVRTIILEHIGKKVPDSTRLVDELGLDSLEVVELSLAIEDCLQIDMPNDAIERFVTIGDVIKCVAGLMDATTR